MGARQVLRVAVVVVCAAARPLVASAQPRGPLAITPVTHAEPVIVIDLRAPGAPDRDPSRAKLADALDAQHGVHVDRAGQLDAALAGDGGGDEADAKAALDAARAAYGALDCKAARPAAERAAIALAARQASGEHDDAAARAAWAYVMLCADRDGDHAGAAVAATMLRALGAGLGPAPSGSVARGGVTDGGDAGVGADTWAKYPEVDARTASLVELTVKAEAGADVWIDLAKLGPAPVTAVVAAGDHVIAAGHGARRAAQRVTVAKATTIDLALADQSAGSWADVAAQVRAWRAKPPAPAELAAIMRTLHVRFAFVLPAGATRTVEVWVLGPGDRVARSIDAGSLDDAAALASLVRARVDAWDAHAPDPDRPLLVEDRAGAGTAKTAAPDHWWVYASLIGAVVLGGVVVYAHDSATDHQRVELRFP